MKRFFAKPLQNVSLPLRVGGFVPGYKILANLPLGERGQDCDATDASPRKTENRKQQQERLQ